MISTRLAGRLRSAPDAGRHRIKNMDTPHSLELAPVKPQELTRQASDIAGLCKEIVLKTAVEIEGKKYVRVEGWQSIATAHACCSGSRDVEQVYGPQGQLLGYKAIGEIRHMATGQVISTAEGFVGCDEQVWFGGEGTKWDKVKRKRVPHTFPKRHDYAIRAMCQTRAVSRVCRAAFAHVVVLMDAGLSTTPAEEVPDGGFVDAEVLPPESPGNPRPPHTRAEPDGGPERAPDADWRNVVVPFGKNKGVTLGSLQEKSLRWYCENFTVEESYEKEGKTVQCSRESVAKQQQFRDALDAAVAEFNWSE